MYYIIDNVVWSPTCMYWINYNWFNMSTCILNLYAWFGNEIDSWQMTNVSVVAWRKQTDGVYCSYSIGKFRLTVVHKVNFYLYFYCRPNGIERQFRLKCKKWVNSNKYYRARPELFKRWINAIHWIGHYPGNV